MAIQSEGPIYSGELVDAKYAAPRFSLEVEGKDLPVAVTQFVERVEYESCENAVDMMKVELLDPDKYISELKLFLPGNELRLMVGYGPSELSHIGNAIITNVRSTFPADGQPSIELTAYTRDHFMMTVRPDPDPPPNVKSNSGKQKDAKFNYNGVPISAVIAGIASSHKLEADVDNPKLPVGSILQPIKMSDYDFVRGLANLTGFYFWVDADENGVWYLHFKDPDQVLTEQEREYKFVYRQGDRSTLLTFEPEMVFKNHYTKIQAQTKQPDGSILKVGLVEGKKHDWSTKPVSVDETVEGEINTAQEIQLFIGEYSFRAIHAGQFKDVASLEKWVEQWFRRHKQDFVIGSGELIGLEDLRSRQIHTLEGLGTMYDGKWNFVRVRHVFDVSSGYTCEVAARKVFSV